MPHPAPTCLALPRPAPLPQLAALMFGQYLCIALQTLKHTQRRKAKLQVELAAALEQAASQGFELAADTVFALVEQGK